MIGDEIRQLEARLWKAADDLRANSRLTATEKLFNEFKLRYAEYDLAG